MGLTVYFAAVSTSVAFVFVGHGSSRELIAGGDPVVVG